ncbi:MAG TPA: protein kinase [Polyangiaceae bacterium]|nr:protein kinase [Polyangiaceae bacterium]
MVAPREQAIIAGKYRLIRQLGQGGMGSVWLAEHLTLCSQVAIKLIHVDMASSAEVLGRFLREAQAAASLRSPHVVQILDHGVDEGTPYIAMELLEGESLADRLARCGRLEPVAVGRMLTEVGRAIGRAHEAGIVHRDLKPDNVFLVRNDDDEVTKVLDFGIAKASSGLGAAASSATRTGALLGTPYYMSPEQAEGARSLDHRTDIWAMGVIAFECLLGRRPFDAETLGGLLLAICTRPIPIPSQCGPVPAGFDAWFARACHRDPAQRFSSAREAASELKRLCEGNASASGAQWTDHSAVSGAPRPADASSAVPAVSGALLASGAAVPNQSFAGLSATQLEAAGVSKRAAHRGLFALLGGLALMLGGAVLAWAHFKSQPLAVATTSAANPAPLPSSSVAARPAESARSDALALPAPSATTLAPRPPEPSPESVATPVRSKTREPTRPSGGVRVTAKQTPAATVAPLAAPPARATASVPIAKPPTRPAVNLGI